MPIDYSKWDSIEDSDEEAAPDRGQAAAAGAIRQAAQASATSAGGPFAPPTRGTSATAVQAQGSHGDSGREMLEPAGLDRMLNLVQPGNSAEMEAMSSQLARLTGSGGGDAAVEGGSLAPAEPADPTEPKRLCVRSEGRKKIHTTFPDGSEMAEEFDERTDVLLLRKVRKSADVLGKESDWVFEVGQPPEAVFDPHSDMLRASSSNPIFIRKDTPEHLQWRIRNLPYPANVYSITVDHDKQDIVVRTSNKKYFKRIAIPDLARLGLKLQDTALSWKHQHNTLIISYTRPAEVAAQEQKALREVERSALKL